MTGPRAGAPPPSQASSGAGQAEEREEERRLVEAARVPGPGRRPAFARLYERHKDAVFAFLLRLVGDPTLAEDALQEAFLRAWRNLERFEPGRAFRPWLLTIARHAATDILRTRGKEARTAARVAPGASPDPRPVEAAAARTEARERARHALEVLPVETRALLIQRHGLGTPLQALAESWEVSERTVRNRLRAAAEELTRALRGNAAGGPQDVKGARA